jgi:hypothetical protein
VTHLDLSGNQISKFPVLDASAYVKFRQSRLRSLYLDSNPIMPNGNEEDQSALLRLLMSAPQLGYVAAPFTTETSSLFTPLIRHYLDWNRCGRVLTTGHEKALPLSMWPLVFARANKIVLEDRNKCLRRWAKLDRHETRDVPDRRPNIIFQLLRGFLSLHVEVWSRGNKSQADNHYAAEPQEKRQKRV